MSSTEKGSTDLPHNDYDDTTTKVLLSFTLLSLTRILYAVKKCDKREK